MLFPSDLTLNAIFTGKAVMRWAGRPASAIAKDQVTSKKWLTRTGIEGDEQADPSVHGGLEKALHHYAADHYRFWKEAMPDIGDKLVPGGFGENLSSAGLTEEDLCIGDVIGMGEAIVQITQGRQPCWKLSAHVGREDMAPRFQKSGFTGWYYRVLQEGYIRAGDPITLIERPRPDWPLPAVIAARFDPRLDPARAGELAGIAEMSKSWRAGFRRKLVAGHVEDTRARLRGR